MATATSPWQENSLDHLAALEERVIKAVTLITELREEREIIMQDLETAIAGRQSAEQTISEREDEIRRLQSELDALRGQQHEVRERVQKALGQLDALVGSEQQEKKELARHYGDGTA